MEHYRQINDFIKGTVAENAPIVPISAQQNLNVDMVIQAIEENIPTPSRDINKPPLLKVARSFDINRPGATPDAALFGVCHRQKNPETNIGEPRLVDTTRPIRPS